jgi:hypothetical protein
MPHSVWKRLLAGILPCVGETRVREERPLLHYTGSAGFVRAVLRRTVRSHTPALCQ